MRLEGRAARSLKFGKRQRGYVESTDKPYCDEFFEASADLSGLIFFLNDILTYPISTEIEDIDTFVFCAVKGVSRVILYVGFSPPIAGRKLLRAHPFYFLRFCNLQLLQIQQQQQQYYWALVIENRHVEGEDVILLVL